jgi:outer membrane protein assembly factor BamB
MNQNMSLERMLATVMADEAAGREPERLLEETLAVTIRQRPAPRWLAVLQEPTMRARTRVVVGIPARGLVMAAALAALLGLALVAALIGSQLLKPPSLTLNDDWLMFRGDVTRAGLTTRGPSGHLGAAWTFHASGAVNGAIAIVGDTVYAPSDDGAVHAIAVSDGGERWSARLDKGPTAGVAVVDGLLFTADGNGRLYALDPASGVVRWRSAASFSTPLNIGAGGGSVFVGAGSDGVIAAIDERTGSTRWQARLANAGAVNAPAFDGTSVYVAAAGGGFFALDASTGATRWHVDTGTDSLGTPVVANGVAYIGSPADASSGHLRAVEAATGRVIWTVDGQISSPTVVGQRLYVVSNGSVAVLDEATGAALWRAAVGGATRAPAVAGGIVYVLVDGEHRLHAFDAASGGELSYFEVDSSNNCCIAVAKGLVFLGTERGTVYAISGDGARLSPAPIVAVAPTPGPSGVAPSGRSGEQSSPEASPSAVPLPTVARFVARFANPPDGLLPNALIRDSAGQVWAAEPYSDRFAVFTPNGQFLSYWGTAGSGDGQFNFRRNNGDGCGSLGFGPGGSIYVLDCGNRRVEQFDRQRRLVRTWGGFGDTPGKFDDPIGIEVMRDGTVYVLDDVRGVVEVYDPSGSVLRTVPVFENIGGPKFNGANDFTVDAAGNIYVSQIEPNQVAEFDPSGALVRTFGADGPFHFSEQPGFLAVDEEGRVFVGQGPGRGDAPGVVVFAPDGRLLGGFGVRGDGNGDVAWPSGIVLDGKGSLFLADVGVGPDPGAKGWIQKFRLLPPFRP